MSERHLGSAVHFTFVEPDPARLLATVRANDHGRFDLVRERVQDVPLDTVGVLGENDILFIDSSTSAKWAAT